MTTREIVTIQLGHYANYVGAHWWNLQESNFSYDPDNPSEINNDVLYREGENLRRQTTYTPRLLLADLKGSLGYLNQEGSLYTTGNENEKHEVLWDTKQLEVTKEEPAKKSQFLQHLEQENERTETLDLQNDINSWVDYLLPRFHPRTVHVIKEYAHQCTVTPFNIFTYGRKLWNEDQFSQDFSDRIRNYVEECGSMQGFQVLLDCNDGFAGLGTSCIEYLRDEYGRSILAFPCMDSSKSEPSVADLQKIVNTALCWQNLSETASLYSPLCCGSTGWPQVGDARRFSHLNYEQQLHYHSSALLATALDTVTLRYRRKEFPNVVLSDLCADLNKHGRKGVATSLSLPFPMTAKRDLIDILDDHEGPLWTSLTPNCSIPMDRNSQSIALRGVPEERLKRPRQEAMKQMGKPAYRCSSVHEMMTLFLACTCHASATYLTTIKAPLLIKDPYPSIFSNNVAENGDITEWPLGADVKSVPVMAGFHSGNSLSAMYESLHKQASRVKSIKKFHAFTTSGLEEDEFKECLDHLLDCKESFEDHYV